MAHLMIVGEFRGEVHGQIAELRNDMRGNHTAVSAEIRRIDNKLTWVLDLRERIVALETKLAVADDRRGASEFERFVTPPTQKRPLLSYVALRYALVSPIRSVTYERLQSYAAEPVVPL